jgi:hypothetical protein
MGQMRKSDKIPTAVRMMVQALREVGCDCIDKIDVQEIAEHEMNELKRMYKAGTIQRVLFGLYDPMDETISENVERKYLRA